MLMVGRKLAVGPELTAAKILTVGRIWGKPNPSISDRYAYGHSDRGWAWRVTQKNRLGEIVDGNGNGLHGKPISPSKTF
jgi:hypothetical protein